MPLYEYQCDDCGVFEELTPLSHYADPCDCPDCGTPALRATLSMPLVSAQTKHAHETNERAADRPKLSSQHGPGCGCCGGSSKKMPNKTMRKTLHRPDGSKSFPSKRPWMISH